MGQDETLSDQSSDSASEAATAPRFLLAIGRLKMKGFRFGSAQGAFYILPGQDGWEATYGNETLGEFSSPQQAADDLARGLTCPHLCETDTSTLEIPEKLSEWEIVHV